MKKKRYAFVVNGFFRGIMEARLPFIAKWKIRKLYNKMFVGKIEYINIFCIGVS